MDRESVDEAGTGHPFPHKASGTAKFAVRIRRRIVEVSTVQALIATIRPARRCNGSSTAIVWDTVAAMSIDN